MFFERDGAPHSQRIVWFLPSALVELLLKSVTTAECASRKSLVAGGCLNEPQTVC